MHQLRWSDGILANRAPIVNTPLIELSGATVLVGSGLSAEERNGLPAGAQVSKAILRHIAQHVPSGFDLFWAYAQTTPFEQIFNGYPDQDRLRKTIAAVYATSITNPFQERLAELVKQGCVSAIITPNYDLCIEAALRRSGVAHTVVVRDDTPIPPGHIPVFKIHGSADDPETLIINLKQEGMLPPWKADLLKRLCSDRPVYVIGYSGSDFDICPHLFGLAPEVASIHWLCRPWNTGVSIDALSGNLRFAAEHSDKVPKLQIVAGDFADALKPPNKDERFVPTQAEGYLLAKLMASASSEQDAFVFWAATLLNSIACRNGGQRALSQLSYSYRRSPKALLLQAALLERAGRYSTAIAFLAAASRASKGQQGPSLRAEICAIAAGTLYTGVYLDRFLLKCLQASAARINAVMHGATVDTAQILRARMKYLRLLRASVLQRTPGVGPVLIWLLRPWLKRNANQAANIFYRQGLWQDVHLVGSKGTDLGIQVTVGPEGASHVIPPSSFGFAQLGNVVGMSSQYRREKKRTADRCKYILDGLRLYGHVPETWKAWMAFRDDLQPADAEELRAGAKRAFRACEYSSLAYWLAGDIRRATKTFR